MEATQQIETVPPTPEQLLKLLDLQLAPERSKRANKSRKRATFLVLGIFFILAAGGIALVLAQGLLAEMKERAALPPTAVQTSETR